MYPGAELPVIDAIKLGSPGCISATANINSKNIGEVIELCHQDNWQKATDLHKNVKEVRYLFQDYSAIPAQKAMLAKKYSNNTWKNIQHNIPSVLVGQGGLLDIELHPDFHENKWIYISYSSSNDQNPGTNTTILRFKIKNFTAVNQEVIYKATPNSKRTLHYGSRMVFDKENYLFVSFRKKFTRK